MTKLLPIVAAAMLLGVALPLSATPAMAQDSQAVRDALTRAQQGAERRAVEDLINRLRGTSVPAAPNQNAAPATGAAPAPATAQPGAAPPATPASAPGTVPPTPPATAASPAPVPTPPATTAAPATPPAAGAPTTATAPTATPSAAPAAVAAPRSGGPAAGGSPATPAAATTAPRPGAPAAATAGAAQGGTPAAAPASSIPAVTIPRGGDVMAKAPEIAEKMNLPRADVEVFFDFNSASVTPQAMSTLAVMGQALTDPALAGQRFIIGGHTDGKGRAEFNLNLSKRRAEAVRKFIIDQYKVEPSRLIARGYGKSQLKNTGMPFADENRRVQIINWTPMMSATRAR